MFNNGVTRSMGFQAHAQSSPDFQLREHNVAVEAPATGWTPEQFDQHCDAFEEALLRGEHPHISDYLRSCPDPQRESLFAELMEVELELRPADGNESSYQNFLQLYPQFANVIETIAFKHGLISTDAGQRADQQGDIPAERLTHIAHFQLQEKLGSGGMGEVWRALDTRLKRTVAVKIPRNRELTEEELHRFLREGRAAAQLKHSNIVSVHEVGRHGSLAYIVSDYIEGPSLQEWLAAPVSGRALAPGSAIQNPKSKIQNCTVTPAASAVPLTASHSSPLTVPPRRAAELCLQLAGALHHAHECGIVHRDLKPGNILISADGQPHVVDFGIAKWEDDTRQLTLAGYAVGTPAYMSPEQAAGNSAQVDRRADVYALGAILYRMLTGRASFEGETVGAVLRAVLNDEPPAPRSINRAIPRDLETICIKAMDKNPGRRYATAEGMGDDLARFLAGEPILGRRPGLLEKSARLIRKRPAMAAAVALGLLAMTAAGVAGLLARENRALQEGLVTVNLQTNPPGARLVFVPLDEATQEPQGDKAVYPGARSPVTVDLKPADYLVVAALDGGRFHEVVRHVPRDRRELITANRHQRWAWTDDELVLPAIDIPELTVTQGMALVDRSSDKDGMAGIEPPLPAFYMDVRELTYRDCPRCFAPVAVEKGHALNRDSAITANFDQACYFAELMGKRLPTAAEFERAAALPRLSQCDVTPAARQQEEFGSAGTPACDRVGRQTPIGGLYSNVAEWTTTVVPSDDPQAPHVAAFFHGRPLPFSLISSIRVVKGGDERVVDGDPTLAPEHRDPSSGHALPRFSTRPGVGLRCVRSVSPRFLRDEMGK